MGAPNGGTILGVYFASRDEAVAEKFTEDSERMRAYTGSKNIHIELATKENFAEQVQKADVVYIRGGDTQKLHQTLLQYPDLQKMFAGKTISASSAGAYVVSRFYFSNSRNDVFEGLGFVPARFVGHFESETHHDSSAVDPLGAMEAYDNDLELIVLKDHEWVVREVDL